MTDDPHYDLRRLRMTALVSLYIACLPPFALSAPVMQQSGLAHGQQFSQSIANWNNRDDRKIPGVEHSGLQSKSMGVEVGFNVYLPPGYTENQQRYPTIYFLHGAGGNENSDAEGFSSLVRSAIEKNKIGPVIVVFPNGGMSGYINESCPKLRYETFFIKELVPHIDAKYRTIKSRMARSIGGFSMGGGGAMGLALKHPDLFCSASSWAAALLGSCPDEKPSYAPAPNELLTKLLKKNANKANRRVRLLLIVGDQDPTKAWQTVFSDQLVRLKLRHEYRVLAGVSHNLGLYYEQTGMEVIQFLANWSAASAQNHLR
ncbi:MAG: esterase family protein [Pyrinomonadaceae bacterium]|nr:esterase family protein [Pyrinomonadaceae bacterium]